MIQTSKLSFLILLFASSYAKGQSLDLNACLQLADQANLQVINAQLDIAANTEQVKAFKAALVPKIAFSGDYRYNAKIPGQVVPAAFFGGMPGTYATVQFGVPFVLSNTIQMTQVLYNPQVNYGLAALEVNTELVKTQQAITKQEVKYQVASLFFSIKAIEQQLQFIDSNLIRMNTLINNMQAMVNQGMVVQTEADKLKINKLTLQSTEESLSASKDQLENLLKLFIGYQIDAPLQLAKDLLIEQSILDAKKDPNFYTLDLIDAQKKMNQEERKGTAMSYLPSVSAYAAYNYNVNMKPEDDFRKGIDGAFVGIRLDWTLFDGMEKHFKQKVNAINAEKIANQYNLTKQQLELAVINNEAQIKVKTRSLELAKEKLSLAQQVIRNTELKFQQGIINSNDLVLAQNGLNEAQTSVVSAYIELRKAEVEYLKSIGNLN